MGIDKHKDDAFHLLSYLSSVPDDLTPEEKQELENIRRRKQELLEDIQVRLKEDIRLGRCT